MPFDDLTGWLPAWCLEHLGAEPIEVLFERRQMSVVSGLRLADGIEVVVKARPDDGRAASCLAAQARLAENGFPCPRPLTPATTVGELSVHAEQLRSGGEVLPGDRPAIAVRYGEVLGWLMAELDRVQTTPPLPNPRWVRWDHAGTMLWPAIEDLDARDQSAVPAFVGDAAARARRRLLAASDLPSVLGHADFEAQNMRWHGERIWAVHDWDSLAWQPEAALAGAACAVFPKTGPVALPPIESSEVFLAAYQDTRTRSFTAEEQQVAWAASVWTTAHDLRWQALGSRLEHHDNSDALQAQLLERLSRAHA